MELAHDAKISSHLSIERTRIISRHVRTGQLCNLKLEGIVNHAQFARRLSPEDEHQVPLGKTPLIDIYKNCH